MNKVLVIGRGGREHALAWKLSKSPKVQTVYVAPGNKGMEDVATIVDIDEMDFDGLVAFAKHKELAFTVVGPEAPLVAGIADRFAQERLPIFAPSAAAAEIEGSKSFAKDLMLRYEIPTAGYKTFTDVNEACVYLENAPMPIVIKVDGLAAGKGVSIAHSPEDAIAQLKTMSEKHASASSKFVIEKFLEGEEFTFMSFVQGENVYPMELSRDYKRAYDGDKGANTGGMGAYSPAIQIDKATMEAAKEQVLQKAASAMAQDGKPFTGFLYGGLMATKNGLKTIEFNARFGDPETEVLLPRLESDLFDVIQSLLKGESPSLKWSNNVAVGVVLAAKGYPDSPEIGYPIHGLDKLQPDSILFHCGTALAEDGGFVTNGGRVLILVRMAKDFATAHAEVYDEIKKIKCDGLFYRTDIAKDVTA